MSPLRPFTDLSPAERVTAAAEAWPPLMDAVTRALTATAPQINKLLRFIDSLTADDRRQEARRVHTAYRRRHGGRW